MIEIFDKKAHDDLYQAMAKADENGAQQLTLIEQQLNAERVLTHAQSQTFFHTFWKTVYNDGPEKMDNRRKLLEGKIAALRQDPEFKKTPEGKLLEDLIAPEGDWKKTPSPIVTIGTMLKTTPGKYLLAIAYLASEAAGEGAIGNVHETLKVHRESIKQEQKNLKDMMDRLESMRMSSIGAEVKLTELQKRLQSENADLKEQNERLKTAASITAAAPPAEKKKRKKSSENGDESGGEKKKSQKKPKKEGKEKKKKKKKADSGEEEEAAAESDNEQQSDEEDNDEKPKKKKPQEKKKVSENGAKKKKKPSPTSDDDDNEEADEPLPPKKAVATAVAASVPKVEVAAADEEFC
jgi:hypothetical protein